MQPTLEGHISLNVFVLQNANRPGVASTVKCEHRQGWHYSRWFLFGVNGSQFCLWRNSTGVKCKQTLTDGCVPLCCICPALLHLFMGKKTTPRQDILSLHSQPAVKSLCLYFHFKAALQYASAHCSYPHFVHSVSYVLFPLPAMFLYISFEISRQTWYKLFLTSVLYGCRVQYTVVQTCDTINTWQLTITINLALPELSWYNKHTHLINTYGQGQAYQ